MAEEINEISVFQPPQQPEPIQDNPFARLEAISAQALRDATDQHNRLVFDQPAITQDMGMFTAWQPTSVENDINGGDTTDLLAQYHDTNFDSNYA